MQGLSARLEALGGRTCKEGCEAPEPDGGKTLGLPWEGFSEHALSCERVKQVLWRHVLGNSSLITACIA